jgi:hypothetical protein
MIVSVLQNFDRAYEQYASLSFLALSMCLDVLLIRDEEEITVLLPEKEVGCRHRRE